MSPDSVFAPISLIAVVIAGVNLLKYIRARDWNAVVTYVAVFIVLVLVLWLYGNSEFGRSAVLPGSAIPLENFGFADLLIAGLAYSGPAIVTWDLFGAIDNSRTTNTPPLLPPKVAASKEAPPTTYSPPDSTP